MQEFLEALLRSVVYAPALIVSLIACVMAYVALLLLLERFPTLVKGHSVPIAQPMLTRSEDAAQTSMDASSRAISRMPCFVDLFVGIYIAIEATCRTCPMKVPCIPTIVQGYLLSVQQHYLTGTFICIVSDISPLVPNGKVIYFHSLLQQRRLYGTLSCSWFA